MGICLSSNNNNYYSEDDYQKIAARNFSERIQAYSYAHHGDYRTYVNYFIDLYELECLPPYVRYGPNYRPQYNTWGNRIK